MFFRNFLSKLKEKKVVLYALFQLKDVKDEDSIKQIKQLKRIFYEIFFEKFSIEEKEMITNIELLRESLNSSKSKIDILTNYNLPGDEKDQYKVNSITIGNACKFSSITYIWAVILFKIIRSFKPNVCFELGTNIGISASYQAAALKLNEKGHLVTFELSKSKVNLANKNFKKLKLDNTTCIVGRFSDTVENELKKYKCIDYVFIDGHHEEYATISYFKLIEPYLSQYSIVVFDDINWSEGMKRAWAKLKTDKKFIFSIDLNRIGISFVR